MPVTKKEMMRAALDAGVSFKRVGRPKNAVVYGGPRFYALIAKDGKIEAYFMSKDKAKERLTAWNNAGTDDKVRLAVLEFAEPK